jgi:hypothetical protein
LEKFCAPLCKSFARRVAKFWVPFCKNVARRVARHFAKVLETFQVSKKYFSKSKTFEKIPKVLQSGALRGRHSTLC